MGPLRLAPLGFQQLDATALAAAHALTPPTGAQVAVLSVVGANSGVSWRDDGTDPTASVGQIILATAPQPYEYWGDLAAIKFILTANTPVLNVSYYKIAG